MHALHRIMFVPLLAMFVASPAFAETKELFLAHVGAPGSMYDLSTTEYVKRVNAKLPPEYKVVAAGNSRFGYDTDVLAKLKTGEVAFGLPGPVMSGISAKFGVFELPFLVRNREQVRKISDALLEPVLQPEVQAKGYRILAIWENGFRQFTNNTRPIKKPEDLNGLKIRTPKGPWWDKVFRTFGVEPIQIEYSKVYDGLKDGTLDGQEAPLAQVMASKFYERQRYLSLSDHFYTPIYLTVSEEHFSKLPSEVQEILATTADEMRSWIYATAIRLESDNIDQLSETMEVNYIDLRAFRRASRPIYGEFARTVPGGFKLIEIVSSLAEVPMADVGMGAAPAQP